MASLTFDLNMASSLPRIKEEEIPRK